MEDKSILSFQEKLDSHYAWPSVYRFKFIVPIAKLSEIKALFPGHTILEKPSGKGNYIGITVDIMANSSDLVIGIYQRAATIEGIVAL